MIYLISKRYKKFNQYFLVHSMIPHTHGCMLKETAIKKLQDLVTANIIQYFSPINTLVNLSICSMNIKI